MTATRNGRIYWLLCPIARDENTIVIFACNVTNDVSAAAIEYHCLNAGPTSPELRSMFSGENGR